MIEHDGEKPYWLAFSVFPGIGPGRFRALLEHFGSAKSIWQASDKQLLDAGLSEVLMRKLLLFRNTFEPHDYEDRLINDAVSYLTWNDELYPKQLQGIRNPPFVLYAKGDISVLTAEHPVAIVGTRRITSYGRDVTQTLTRDLVDAGCLIVSGLAMGVDAVAHQTTIAAKGETVAVLGCGVDCCHPTENQAIYNSIVSGYGVVVSEYPLGMKPSKGSFPSRNRIIAGLSDGVVVTEGTEDSGALITAKDAFENGRSVFAVPGPITSGLSKGPNKLLAGGATLVTNVQDILSVLKITSKVGVTKKRIMKGDSVEEQKVIDLLLIEPLQFNILVRKTGIPSQNLGSIVTMMEVKGIVSTQNSIISLNTT
jgi:DNA processing protein